MDEQVAQLDAREENLKKELAELEANREALAAAVDEWARGRYERLVRSKGENVVVGVQHGVCGGCHMRLPPQLLVTCQAEQELVACTNCGRILYYTPRHGSGRGGLSGFRAGGASIEGCIHPGECPVSVRRVSGRLPWGGGAQCRTQLVFRHRQVYSYIDFGRAENRFPRSNPGEEESPNTTGRDAA